MALRRPRTADKVEDRVAVHVSRKGTQEVVVNRVVETTECDRLAKTAAQSQPIGDFLAWLQDVKGYTLCEIDRFDRFEPVRISIERLLAEYFDIDLDQVERERRALLAALQESHAP